MKVEVFLKSGQIVKFECDKANFTFSKLNCEFTGYEFKGLRPFQMVSIVPSQIAAYTVK